MILRVTDLSATVVADRLTQEWRNRFPQSGHIVEFGLCASSPAHADAIFAAWSRIIPKTDVFIDPPDKGFPCLVSFAVGFNPAVSDSESAEKVLAISESWQAAILADGDAEVVSQSFCAYGNPILTPTGPNLDRIAGVLHDWRQSGCLRNLASLSKAESDELIEFRSADRPESGPVEASLYRSDLAQASITLAFQVHVNLNTSSPIDQVSALLQLAPHRSGISELECADWRRIPCGRSATAAIATLNATTIDDLHACGVSVNAWKSLSPIRTGRFLLLRSSNSDLLELCPFSFPDPFLPNAHDVESTWTLPDVPCFQSLASLGLRVERK